MHNDTKMQQARNWRDTQWVDKLLEIFSHLLENVLDIV